MAIKYTTTKNDWVKEELKGEIKRHKETNENDNMTYQNLCSKSGNKRAVHIIVLSQETREILYK